MLIQSQHTSIRPLTTAHLATTMTLMGLTAAELRQKIEAELANNPALEVVEEHRCPTCRRPLAEPGACPVCSRPSAAAAAGDSIVFVSPREDFYTSGGMQAGEDSSPEEYVADSEDLPTYVLRQIAPELPVEDRLLAAHILTGLDEDGLLRIPLIEIARYHHVTLGRVQGVLSLIQHADPVGVGSPSPMEALLVQLDVLAETDDIPPLTERAIREGMDLLSRRQYVELGRLLGVSTGRAREIAMFIGENLNPYPGRAHWGNIHQPAGSGPQVYHHPDIIISQLNNQPDASLVVEVISPMAGKLRVSSLFRQALTDAPAEKTEQWQADLERASLLIKCLQQRNHTMVRMMQLVSNIQRKFILHGDAHIEPLTRASLADVLQVHESTISRAVSGKAVQLPSGRIVPLSRLFDRSLHIRTELRQIVSRETKPLTDTQIASLLKTRGYPIARRTVAKYRAMEGILPAHLRQPVRQTAAQT